LTDDALANLLKSSPLLTHLDLEELDELTNATLQNLSKSPCAPRLEHLSISYCENLGDTGMLQVLRACTSIQSLDMDNTRISDLVLMEAAAQVRRRGNNTTAHPPKVGLRMVVFDCQNVTWAGVREVMSRNTNVQRFNKPFVVPARVPSPGDPSSSTAGLATRLPRTDPTKPAPAKQYPSEIIQLKCFYGWQMTVEEHTKRVVRGDFAAAGRLERKWADYMMANEEAGAGGAGARRRRRRAREAAMLHADEEDGTAGGAGATAGGGRRRRARSGGCIVM
jgi:F-box/leucine-rich repeat protein 2/20